jgi:DNA repair photolyase
MIRDMQVKSALHFHNRRFATNYDLNIYRGCEHRCQYCFAQYTHDYLDGDFFGDIFVKTNIAEVLDKELSKKTWKKNLIDVSAVCDCYQPIEKQYRLMVDVLEVLTKHKNPVFILTKSPLIFRDFELIKKLNEVAQVCVSTSVTTLDESISEKLEANVVSGVKRLEIIKEFAQLKGCKTCVLLAPIIPYLTDTTENIEGIFKMSKKYGANAMVCDVLNLRGKLKEKFFDFLSHNFPFTLQHLHRLYRRGAYVDKNYNNKLEVFLDLMRKKYGLYWFKSGELEHPRKNTEIEPDLFCDI